MPIPKRLPTTVRNVRARFRSLLRPQVWGPTAVLLLGALFAWDYWTETQAPRSPESNQIESLNPPSAGSRLTSEESAIGADIDSLSVLLKEINSGSDDVLSSLAIADPDAPAQPGLFDSIFRGQNQNSGNKPTDTPVPNSSTGATASQQTSLTTAAQDYKLLNFDPSAKDNAVSGTATNFERSLFQPGSASSLPGSSLVTPGEPPKTVAPVSALQSAMDKYQATQAQPLPTTENSPNSTGQLPYGNNTQTFFPTTGQPSTPNPLDYRSTFPVTTPAAPISPYPYAINSYTGEGPQSINIVPPSAPTIQTVPVTPGSVNQPAFQNSNPLSGLNNSGLPSTNNSSPAQAVQSSPPPFSVPRSIGNGEINTFSNP